MRFHYKDRVMIIGGFYKGYSGTVEDHRKLFPWTTDSYVVAIDNKEEYDLNNQRLQVFTTIEEHNLALLQVRKN